MVYNLASETQPLRQCMEWLIPYRETAMMPTMIRVDSNRSERSTRGVNLMVC